MCPGPVRSLPRCSSHSRSARCRPVSALRPPHDRTQDSPSAPSATRSFTVQRRPSLLLTDATTALRHAPSTVALPSFWPLCPASFHGPRPRRSTRPSSRTAVRRPRVLLQRRALLHGRHEAAETSRKAAPPFFSDRCPHARRPSSAGSCPSRRRGPRPARGSRASTAASRGDFNAVPWPGADLRPCPPSVHAWALLYRLNEHRAGEACARAWGEARAGPCVARGCTRTRRGCFDPRLVHARFRPLFSQAHGQPSPAYAPALPSRSLLLCALWPRHQGRASMEAPFNQNKGPQKSGLRPRLETPAVEVDLREKSVL